MELLKCWWSTGVCLCVRLHCERVCPRMYYWRCFVRLLLWWQGENHAAGTASWAIQGLILWVYVAAPVASMLLFVCLFVFCILYTVECVSRWVEKGGDKDHDSAAAASGWYSWRDGAKVRKTSISKSFANSLLKGAPDSRQSAVADNLHLLSSSTVFFLLFFFPPSKQPY